MGQESALRYHENEAKAVEGAITRILRRLNCSRTPHWLIDELETAHQKIQCIRAERGRDLKAFLAKRPNRVTFINTGE